MPELEQAYLLATGGIIVVSLAAYAYAALSAPKKSIFQRPWGHVEVRDLRKIKGN